MKAHLAASLAFTFLILAICAHLAISDPKPLQLKVLPQIGFEPQDLFLQIRLQPQTTDRILHVGCDFTSTEWPLEGQYAPKFYSVTWRGVPAGDYLISAEVGDGFKHPRAVASVPVSILPR